MRDETVSGRSMAARQSSRTTRTGAIYILFHEYFHGDNGAGLGASHQTGWTGLIARVLDMFARFKPEGILAESSTEYMAEITRQQVAGD